MRTSVTLDDDLVRLAQEFTGIEEKTALLREALKALIEGRVLAGWCPWKAPCRN